jgi:hypothetical protein
MHYIPFESWEALMDFMFGGADPTGPRPNRPRRFFPPAGRSATGLAGEGLVVAEYERRAGSLSLARPMTDLLTGRRHEGAVEIAPPTA